MKIIRGKKYITREDLEHRLFGIWQYKPGKLIKDLFVQATSGTTSGKPAIIAIRFILDKKLLAYYKDYYSRPLLLLLPNYCYSLLWAEVVLEHFKKARILTLNKRDMEHPLLYSILSEFEPEIIRSPIASILNYLIDNLPKDAFALVRKVKTIYMGGERPSSALLQKLRATFPESELKLHYGTVEIGIVGIHCSYLAKKYGDSAFRIFHPIKRLTIVEPDSEGVGEIAGFTPELPGYLTGDAGRLIKEKCRCGASETLFLYGRINYDLVNCVGAVFHISEVERVFLSLSDYVKDYYLEIKDVLAPGKTFGSVTISVVPTEKLRSMKNGEHFVCEFVRKHLQLTKTRYLGDLVRDGIFLPPKTVFVSSFPESGKKIRMRKVGA